MRRPSRCEIAPVARQSPHHEGSRGREGGTRITNDRRCPPVFQGMDAFGEIEHYCRQLGIVFMSTPFDKGSVDLLNDLGVVAFKIGSGELTNLPFLSYVAAKGKPS